MYSGQHGEYVWELVDSELVISSPDPKIGVLKRQAANGRFNNAEQATWYAQGQIDMQSEAMAAILESRATSRS